MDPEFPPGGPFTGTFTAHGPAVRSGVVCAEGTILGFAADPPASPFWDFAVDHTFTCDDGSGDFTLNLRVRTHDRGSFFAWSVKDGTGDYSSTSGRGLGWGRDLTEDIFRDVYLGRVSG